jgi:prepilin-type N-terminal cleavage/methylation domain-containing protein
MKMTKTKLAKGFTLVELLVVIAIIAALAALSTPVVLKQQKKANATTAVNNSKQIFLLLFEYDQENASYPVGDSSNTSLAKLITEGYTTSEEIFFAKTNWAGKPNGDVSSTDALLAGELGFKYAANLSAGKASGLPLLGAPFVSEDAGEALFDIELYAGQAVVLFNDGSARTLRISPEASAGAGGLVAGGGDADVFGSAKIGSLLTNLQAALPTPAP